MVVFLANAFSLNMLKKSASLTVKEISIDVVKELLADGFVSAIGHEGTAQILSEILQIYPIPVNRVPIKLEHGDTVIVFQLMTRLPEGKILTREELQQLVQQGQAKFYRVRVYYME